MHSDPKANRKVRARYTPLVVPTCTNLSKVVGTPELAPKKPCSAIVPTVPAILTAADQRSDPVPNDFSLDAGLLRTVSRTA